MPSTAMRLCWEVREWFPWAKCCGILPPTQRRSGVGLHQLQKPIEVMKSISGGTDCARGLAPTRAALVRRCGRRHRSQRPSTGQCPPVGKQCQGGRAPAWPAAELPPTLVVFSGICDLAHPKTHHAADQGPRKGMSLQHSRRDQ